MEKKLCKSFRSESFVVGEVCLLNCGVHYVYYRQKDCCQQIFP